MITTRDGLCFSIDESAQLYLEKLFSSSLSETVQQTFSLAAVRDVQTAETVWLPGWHHSETMHDVDEFKLGDLTIKIDLGHLPRSAVEGKLLSRSAGVLTFD
jgi:hypothetical protein